MKYSMFFLSFNLFSMDKNIDKFITASEDQLKKVVKETSIVDNLETIQQKLQNLVNSLSKNDFISIFDFIANLKIKNEKNFKANFLKSIYNCINEKCFDSNFLQMINDFFIINSNINLNRSFFDFFYFLLHILENIINKSIDQENLFTQKKRLINLISEQKKSVKKTKLKIDKLKLKRKKEKDQIMKIIHKRNNLCKAKKIFEYIEFKNIENYFKNKNIPINLNENNEEYYYKKYEHFYKKHTKLKKKLINNIDNYKAVYNKISYPFSTTFICLEESNQIFYEDYPIFICLEESNQIFYEDYPILSIELKEKEKILNELKIILKLEDGVKKNNFNQIIFDLTYIFKEFYKKNDIIDLYNFITQKKVISAPNITSTPCSNLSDRSQSTDSIQTCPHNPIKSSNNFTNLDEIQFSEKINNNHSLINESFDLSQNGLSNSENNSENLNELKNNEKEPFSKTNITNNEVKTSEENVINQTLSRAVSLQRNLLNQENNENSQSVKTILNVNKENDKYNFESKKLEYYYYNSKKGLINLYNDQKIVKELRESKQNTNLSKKNKNNQGKIMIIISIGAVFIFVGNYLYKNNFFN